ncbi:efflux RND transporter permease subunit [Arthrobacter methylotrophus]|uniref:efflux RND transporter permease subunit n=1 Tax=Arthrobacter methylotrophus TaxID=121291 RepID=UPI003CD0A75E
MTALAMIIGMVPMALGLGEGAEQNAPLGRAVIGGLLFATVSTSSLYRWCLPACTTDCSGAHNDVTTCGEVKDMSDQTSSVSRRGITSSRSTRSNRWTAAPPCAARAGSSSSWPCC